MVDAQLSINLFDAIVFGVLFMLAMLSMFRGFIREVLSLIGWIGAAMITLHSVKGVVAWILPYVESKFVATIIGTMGTYFVALFSISIFSRLILRYVKEGTDVGVADNLMGLFFGVFKGWVIISLAFLVYSQVVKKEEYPDWLATAYTLPAVESSAEIGAGLLPNFMKDVMPITDKAKEQAEKDGESINDNGFEIESDVIDEEVKRFENDIEDKINKNNPDDMDELDKLLNRATGGSNE